MLRSCKNIRSASYLIILCLFAIDIITKYIFTDKKIFENFLIGISYAENRGSAFSIFSDVEIYNLLIILLSVMLLIFLIYYLKKYEKNKFYFISLVFLISGLLGNLFDRIVFGYVRDFISLKYLFIFNFADLYLTIGIIFLLYYEFSRK